MYLDNYAEHMRNFTDSVDCWEFLVGGEEGGGGVEAGSNHFITQKKMLREGRGA